MIFILEDNDERITGFKAALGDISHHIERTVPEAITWLTEHKERTKLYSLDNDLYVPSFEGDEGEGWQLCEWLLANSDKVPIVTHTSNNHAAVKMRLACADADWSFTRVVPLNSFEWIADTWLNIVLGIWPRGAKEHV